MEEQYPRGTELLWMAHYRSEPDNGDIDGETRKISGIIQEAAAEAQKYAEDNGLVLQCLRRRF